MKWEKRDVIAITQSEIGGRGTVWRRIYVFGRKAGDLKTPSTDWGETIKIK